MYLFVQICFACKSAVPGIAMYTLKCLHSALLQSFILRLSISLISYEKHIFLQSQFQLIYLDYLHLS